MVKKKASRAKSPKVKMHYFAVKAVPVNAKSGKKPLLVTKSRVPPGNQLLTVDSHPTWNKGHAFRFEVIHLNDNVKSLGQMRTALRTNDGQAWLDDSVDHAIFKVITK